MTKRWLKVAAGLVGGFFLAFIVQVFVELVIIALAMLVDGSDKFFSWYMNAGVVEKLSLGLLLVLAQLGLVPLIWRRWRSFAYGYMGYVGSEMVVTLGALVDWWMRTPSGHD